MHSFPCKPFLLSSDLQPMAFLAEGGCQQIWNGTWLDRCRVPQSSYVTHQLTARTLHHVPKPTCTHRLNPVEKKSLKYCVSKHNIVIQLTGAGTRGS